jgi:hypothetical protein
LDSCGDWRRSFAQFIDFAPYNEHLLHDVGAFQIGIGATLLLALLWNDALAVALAGFVVGGGVHTVSHIVDRRLGGHSFDPWALGALAVVGAIALAIRLRPTRGCDLRDDVLQDPVFRRSGGAEKGRDGCRVPLPWTIDGPSFGFGHGRAHLPQPAWFGSYSVEAQESDPASTLQLYRQALKLRTTLQCAEELEWLESADAVLHFVRPGGWRSITNYGTKSVAVPQGSVVLASDALDGDQLPPDTTAWLLDANHGS